MLSGGNQHELADHATPGTDRRAVGAPTAATRPSAAPHSAGAPFASELTVALDTIPASPPQEVLDQMASAAQAHETLSAQGRELRFSRDAQSGRTRIEVRDRGGNVLKTLSPAQALEVAAGAPVE